jgi:putative two-component system response regulator
MSFNLYFEIAKRGTAPFLVGKSLGDLLFRRLAVVALIGPVGVGMMTLTAEHLGYVQGTTGVSLQITAIVTVFFIALSRVAKVLEESESQRNEAQNDLEQQEHFLTTVINSIPSFIFIKNADGQFLLANKATADVYGTTLDELIGKRDADFCSDPEQVQNFIEKDREALRTHDKVLILQESITDSTGEMRWLQTVKVPISSPTGELQVLGVSTDITEIKKIEQELLRSQSQLREAHEELEAQNFSLERMIRDRTLDLEQAQMEMLRRLATAAEFRDDDTGEHTSRVSELSGLIAEGLGLPQRQVEMIRSAAALHDLGKIGISDTLFLKPGKLTVEEFEIMKSHTIIAGKILGGSPSPLLQLAEKIAMAHHEKWDGSGYPNGLRSDEIPHEARIVAVADVFDALTHARPYKDAWPKEAALDEIQRLSGSHLDPEVVQIFVSLMAEEELDLRKAA